MMTKIDFVFLPTLLKSLLHEELWRDGKIAKKEVCAWFKQGEKSDGCHKTTQENNSRVAVWLVSTPGH